MPIPPRIHTLLAVLAGGLGLGCEPNDPALAPSAAPPALAISDGAHGGNPHFYFLPPLVHTPAATGTFDPAVSPTVTICALTAGACGVTIATYTTSSGPGGEIVSLDAADKLYRLNWKTGDFALSDAVNYRIQVFAGSVSLGFADVDVARHASEFRDLSSGDVIGLVDGRTLPIKFRIETGVVGSILITPATADLEVGDTLQFAAVVLDPR